MLIRHDIDPEQARYLFWWTMILGSWLSELIKWGPKAMFAAIAKFFKKISGG